MLVRGVDVRKIELHEVAMSTDDDCNHRIVDYYERGHGTTSVTVEQAESLILDGLRAMFADWQDHPLSDVNGTEHRTDLTLIDKGWMGSWKTEDGTFKTWVSQPVETFCLEMGLRNFMPAKGAPRYQSPAPSNDCIVGDNWHMNFGPGKERACTEIIWNAAHWHMLVEELFMVSNDDPDRFVLFEPGDGYWTNHKRFGEHITVGATEMKDQLSRGTQSRKPRFVKDHWWDAMAMALVAKSVEGFIRLYQNEEVSRPIQRHAQTASIEMPSRNRW